MKPRTRLLSVLLTLVLLLSLVPTLGTRASAAGETVRVSTAEELDTALWNHNKTDTPYTICLDSDITTNRTDIGNQQVTIDLCGRTINGTQNSNVLLVIDDGAKVTVKDSKGGGKIIYTVDTEYSSSNALFSVSDDGLLTIDSGTFLITSPNATTGYVIRGGSKYDNLLIDINGGVFRNETGYTKSQWNGCFYLSSGKAEIENAAFYSPTEGIYLETANPYIPATATVNSCTFETGLSAIASYDGKLSIGAATFTVAQKYEYAIYTNNLYLKDSVADFIQDGYKAYVDGELYTKTDSRYLGTGEAGCVVEITDKTFVSNPTITGLDAPTHGKAADYTASVSAPGCTVTKISYTMFKKVLDPYVGSRGDNLGIEVTVKAASGTSFPARTKATWNGTESYSATVSAAGDECVYLFPYSVGAEDSAILKNLSFTVAAPAIGKAPAATVTAPQGVTVESVNWTPADSAFKEGVSYTVKIGFQADSTHVLADDFLNTGTAAINGQSAQLSKPTTGGIKDTFLTTCYASFTFPALKAGEQPVSPDRTNPFTDVKESDYFYEPVLWAVEKEVTNGTSATTFSPSRTCTRAQIITFLWRASGSPEPGISCPFTDVPAGSYYEKATAWAAKLGMASGTAFGPNDPCTRLMAVEFMWIQSGKPDAPAASFEDVSSPAVNWAVEAGVTNGTSATRFSPDKTCTRGQIVTFLYRYLGD